MDAFFDKSIFDIIAQAPAEVENPPPPIHPSGHAALAHTRSSFRPRFFNPLGAAHKRKKGKKSPPCIYTSIPQMLPKSRERIPIRSAIDKTAGFKVSHFVIPLWANGNF